MTADESLLEGALKRDRIVVTAGLLAVSLASWLYILSGAGMRMAMPMDGLAMRAVWSPGYFALMLVMWWVMMVAMMLPTAAPMLLLFAVVNRKSRESGGTYVPTAIFASGYLAAWGGFSLLAVLLQWGLEELKLLSAMMTTTSLYLGGLLLVGAGLYQMTPLKYACLRHCRSPLQFVTQHWRPGAAGAFRMGIEHGLFCLGCCWLLMVLLFYGGVMNLLWIAGLAAYVLVEKLAPAGHWISRFSGLLLIAWGLWVLAAGYLG